MEQSPTKKIKLSAKDAEDFVRKVQERFNPSQPHIYANFIGIVTNWNTKKTDPHLVFGKVEKLFSGHLDLVREFSLFLPEGSGLSMRGGKEATKMKEGPKGSVCVVPSLSKTNENLSVSTATHTNQNGSSTSTLPSTNNASKVSRVHGGAMATPGAARKSSLGRKGNEEATAQQPKHQQQTQQKHQKQQQQKHQKQQQQKELKQPQTRQQHQRQHRQLQQKQQTTQGRDTQHPSKLPRYSPSLEHMGCQQKKCKEATVASSSGKRPVKKRRFDETSNTNESIRVSTIPQHGHDARAQAISCTTSCTPAPEGSNIRPFDAKTNALGQVGSRNGFAPVGRNTITTKNSVSTKVPTLGVFRPSSGSSLLTSSEQTQDSTTKREPVIDNAQAAAKHEELFARALQYQKQVQTTFATCPGVVSRFSEVVRNYHQNAEARDEKAVEKAVDEIYGLFNGFPDLIFGFNCFLPEGFEIGVVLDENESVLMPASSRNDEKQKTIQEKLPQQKITTLQNLRAAATCFKTIPESAEVRPASVITPPIDHFPRKHVNESVIDEGWHAPVITEPQRLPKVQHPPEKTNSTLAVNGQASCRSDPVSNRPFQKAKVPNVPNKGVRMPGVPLPFSNESRVPRRSSSVPNVPSRKPPSKDDATSIRRSSLPRTSSIPNGKIPRRQTLPTSPSKGTAHFTSNMMPPISPILSPSRHKEKGGKLLKMKGSRPNKS